MTILAAVFLGTVQGLAEFLPISSSGHLVLAQKLLGFTKPPIFFDVALHIGTLIAVLIFFFPRITQIAADFADDLRRGDLKGKGVKFVVLLAAASVPAFVVGLGVSFFVDAVFNSFAVLGVGFLVTAALLFLSRQCSCGPCARYLSAGTALPCRVHGYVNPATTGIARVFIIGLFQSLAVFPGVSRSGSTIVGGLFAGLSREQAFEFSFLLSIPAIVGAGVLEILKGAQGFDAPSFAVGMLVSGIVGWFALRLLKKAVVNKKLYYFGFYCLALAVLCLFKVGVAL